MSDEQPKLSDLLQAVSKSAKSAETTAQKLAATEAAIIETEQKLADLRASKTGLESKLADDKTGLTAALADVDRFSNAVFSAKAQPAEGAK
jgi:septal ring factor EnvC (AmiA/AmiB activator)